MRLLPLLALLCGLLPAPAAAQHQKTAIQLQTDSLLTGLRAAGVDTICVYESYCVGCRSSYLHEDSPCRTKGIFVPTYLFWRQAGRSYGRRLDNCSIGSSQQLRVATFWPYLLAHHQSIKQEKIKEFVHLDHGAVASFHFYLPQATTSQHFWTINLVRSVRHPTEKNRYYRHNRHTHTAELYKMLEVTLAAEFSELK